MLSLILISFQDLLSPELPTHAVTTRLMPLNGCGCVCIPRHRDAVKSLEPLRSHHRGIWLFKAFR